MNESDLNKDAASVEQTTKHFAREAETAVPLTIFGVQPSDEYFSWEEFIKEFFSPENREIAKATLRKLPDDILSLILKTFKEKQRQMSNVSKLNTDDRYQIDIQEDESNEEHLNLSVTVKVKKACIENKQGLIEAVRKHLKETVESHLIEASPKRTFSQI